MTWMTPFDAVMSVLMMLQVLPDPSVTVSLPPVDFTVTVAPLTVLMGWPGMMSAAFTAPGTT